MCSCKEMAFIHAPDEMSRKVRVVLMYHAVFCLNELHCTWVKRLRDCWSHREDRASSRRWRGAQVFPLRCIHWGVCVQAAFSYIHSVKADLCRSEWIPHWVVIRTGHPYSIPLRYEVVLKLLLLNITCIHFFFVPRSGKITICMVLLANHKLH